MATVCMGSIASAFDEPKVNFTQITNSGFFDAGGDVSYISAVEELNGQAVVLTWSPHRVHWRSGPTGNWSSFDYNSIQTYCITYFNGYYIRGGDGQGISATRYSTTINSNGTAGSGNANDKFNEFIIAGSNLFAIGRNSNGQACIYKSTNGIDWSTVYIDGTTQYASVTKQLVSGVWHLWIGDNGGNIKRFRTSDNAMIDTIDVLADSININDPVFDIVYVPAWDMIVAIAGGYLWATPTTQIWRSMARSTNPWFPSYDYEFQYRQGWDGGKFGNKPLAVDAAGKLIVAGRTGTGTSGHAFYFRTSAPTLREIYLGTYYGNQWSMSIATNRPTTSWFTQKESNHLRYFPTLGWIFMSAGYYSGTTSKGFAYTTNTTIS